MNASLKSAGIRIIAGRCRGRRLQVPPGDGLRPTPERLRETLFNWLQADLAGARVLDLFAGSGALGLEAWSRGAVALTLVEQDPAHLRILRQNAAACGVPPQAVQHADALAWLRGPVQSFDLVFLDPPYGQGLIATSAALLEQGQWLAPQALIYVELEAALAPQLPALLPANWQIKRAKTSGQVSYNLCQRHLT